MGHPGNWTPRKLDHVRRENGAADRDRLRAIVLYQHTAAELAGQRGPDFFRMNPCETFRVFRFQVYATCMGCLARNEVTAYELDDTAWAHRHWPAVMGELVCPACGSCPKELRFRSHGADVGAISIEPTVTLHVRKDIGFTKPEPSRGEIDPFAQHDDGALT